MVKERDKSTHEEDEEISQKLSEEYSDALLDAIQNGASLKDVQGITDQTMQGVYSLAYDFYSHGKLNDAESLFRFLCVYDFHNPEYAMGLAAVYQLKKNYHKAIDFYALAYSQAKDDYRPMFYAGQCNLMLRRGVQAKRCFEIVANRCGDAFLKKKAEVYLSELQEINIKGDEDTPGDD